MSQHEIQATSEQIRVFRAMTTEPDFNSPVRTNTREQILANAEPMGFTAIRNPLDDGGITIVSPEFLAIMGEGNTITFNKLGLFVPSNNEQRLAARDGEMYHFDSTGHLVGIDFYHLIRGEELEAHTSRMVFEGDKLVLNRHGFFSEFTSPSDFRYQEDGVPEEEEESVDSLDKILELEDEKRSAFLANLENLPEADFNDLWNDLKAREDQLDNAEEEVRSLQDQLQEADKEDKPAIRDDIREAKLGVADAQEELERVKSVAEPIKKEKERRVSEKLKKEAEELAKLREKIAQQKK